VGELRSRTQILIGHGFYLQQGRHTRRFSFLQAYRFREVPGASPTVVVQQVGDPRVVDLPQIGDGDHQVRVQEGVSLFTFPQREHTPPSTEFIATTIQARWSHDVLALLEWIKITIGVAGLGRFAASALIQDFFARFKEARVVVEQ